MKTLRIALLATLAALSACTPAEDRFADLEAFFDETSQRPPAPIEPLPELPEQAPFVFDADAAPDPFAPLDARTRREERP